jgi:hypothetical protein
MIVISSFYDMLNLQNWQLNSFHGKNDLKINIEGMILARLAGNWEDYASWLEKIGMCFEIDSFESNNG